jgi:hypothetical protein
VGLIPAVIPLLPASPIGESRDDLKLLRISFNPSFSLSRSTEWAVKYGG